MVGIKINVTIEGENVEAYQKTNALEFASATLPSGSTVQAEAIDIGMGVTILNIKTSGLLSPSDVKVLNKYVKNRVRVLIQQRTPKVLILSGRMPIWVYVSVVHEIMHVIPTIGVFDPKLQGAIITVSHNRAFEEGELLKLPNEIVSKLLS